MRTQLLLLAIAACATAHADDDSGSTTREHISSIEGSYQFQRDRENHVNASGFGADISQDLFPHTFVGASYSQVRTQPFSQTIGQSQAMGREQYDTAAFLLGGYIGGEKAALTMTAGAELFGTKGLEGFADEEQHWRGGFAGSLTGSYTVLPHLDAMIGGGYSVVGLNRGAEAFAGLSWDIFRHLAIDTSYWAARNADGLSAGLRLKF